MAYLQVRVLYIHFNKNNKTKGQTTMARHNKKATAQSTGNPIGAKGTHTASNRLQIRQEQMETDRPNDGLHNIKPGSQNRKK